MMRIKILVLLLAANWLGTLSLIAQELSFNHDIRPILSNKCFQCHGPDQNQVAAGLRLESRDSATQETDSGSIPIVPGDPDESELILRVAEEDDDLRMPPADFGARLSDQDVETLRKWIAQGAKYEKHWAYIPPTQTELPTMDAEFAEWPINAIDRFVFAKMKEQGLRPSKEADRASLARRVYLDLTGLPPTVEEVDAFVNNPDSNAYEKLVDELLRRPSYGEHWARKWLDLARYADSAGYADDPARTIWAYRDWVIRAINNNMPYDQFTIEQLAGDLLPTPTDEQLIATAFHRNTQTNNEGGTNDEEFRNVAVVDRVNTTFAVWMGTTMACAQCHHHKYDPISQEDYFAAFAIFDNTQDADRGDDSPVLKLFTDEQKSEREMLTREIEALQSVLRTPTEELRQSQLKWERDLRTATNWTTVTPQSALRSNGEALALQEEQSLFNPNAAQTDTYTLEIPVPINATGSHSVEQISAIRLEALPKSILPNQGSGHGGGNFVITQIHAQFIPDKATTPAARFVRIAIAGKQKILSLAEVEVLSKGENCAPKSKATQSSTDYDGRPELAIDGNTNGSFGDKSVTHTAKSDDPWWELDLQESIPIEAIRVWNRTDEGVTNRLENFDITLLDENRNVLWKQAVHAVPNPSVEISPSNRRPLKFTNAFADFEQPDFPAKSVIDGKNNLATGWAIGGATSNPHQLTLVLEKPFRSDEPGNIRFVIEQNSMHENHLLGSFRLSVSADDSTIKRAKLPREILSLLDQANEEHTDSTRNQLETYFREEVASELESQRAQLHDAQAKLAAIKPSTSVLIMRELVENRRTTNLQYRGSYLEKGPVIEPGIPVAFREIGEPIPTERLALARWLVSKHNPLTPRVLANRYWESFFGRGLVTTSEEFGSQGDLPSHPKLLDWLAVEILDHHWDTRYLVKLMVMSATYRQRSDVTKEVAEIDRDNRWLSRGPRIRLSAEAIRDQALCVSGLLSSKMYGPPVRPPQPNSGLTAAFGNSTDWQNSEGDDRYRRAIYTTWRRSNPYPSMTTFDAPNRETCTVRRNNTNTPLQSLVTLNDPVFVEAAQALARRAIQTSNIVEEQIRAAFQRCLLRLPNETELAALVNLYADTRSRLSGQLELAIPLATEPLGALPPELNSTDAAAMTVVCNVILNLDEVFLKR